MQFAFIKLSQLIGDMAEAYSLDQVRAMGSETKARQHDKR